MQIWVDADAAPRVVKEMLFRASERSGVLVTLVANQWLKVPSLQTIEMKVVGQGFDVADEFIAENVEANDLVITSDIPLAAAVVEKGAFVLEPRGDVIDEANAQSRLKMRDFLETMRESGVMTGGPKPISDRDKRKFAAVLEKWLTTGTVR